MFSVLSESLFITQVEVDKLFPNLQTVYKFTSMGRSTTYTYKPIKTLSTPSVPYS